MCTRCSLENIAFTTKTKIIDYYTKDHFTAYEIACIMAINPSTVESIIEENVL